MICYLPSGGWLAKRLAAAAWLGAAAAGGALAQPRAAAPSTDSLRGRRLVLPEAVVAAQRATPYALGSSRLVLDSAALSQYRGGTLAEALAARTPLYFKSYGPGQLASVSIRGTSARHAAVLWNGISLNISSLGEADFALLPASASTRVEVQPGPAAALYGSGAVGGAVLLSGAPAPGLGWQGSVQAEAGSFSLLGGSVELGHATARQAWRSTVQVRTAQNDFALAAADRRPLGPTRQLNAALTQWSLTHDLRRQLGPASQLMLAAWLTGTDRQIAAALSAANRHGREQDHSARLLAELRLTPTPRYEALARLALVADALRYGDDLLPAATSRLGTLTAQTEHTLRLLAGRTSLRLGAEGQYFVAEVPDYERTRREARGAAYALLAYCPTPRLRLSAGLRQAALPDRRPPLAPLLGLEWDARPAPAAGAPAPLTLKASAARSYRAPTLNERYWQPGGNPQLRPETGWGAEVGLRAARPLGPAGQLRTEATAFWQLVDDWVQWVPNAAGFYAPQNLRQVRTHGLELNLSADWRRPRYQAGARLAGAFTRAQKQRGYAADPDPAGLPLPFVPALSATASAELTWRGRWLASAAGSLTSFRYITVAANDFLPGYTLVQAGLGRHLGRGRVRSTVLLHSYNLTNARYQTYPDRAQPPRSLLLSWRVSWR